MQPKGTQSVDSTGVDLERECDRVELPEEEGAWTEDEEQAAEWLSLSDPVNQQHFPPKI